MNEWIHYQSLHSRSLATGVITNWVLSPPTNSHQALVQAIKWGFITLFPGWLVGRMIVEKGKGSQAPNFNFSPHIQHPTTDDGVAPNVICKDSLCSSYYSLEEASHQSTWFLINSFCWHCKFSS